jgi:hypothetical protein
MSLCTVAELKSALGVGSLYPDATLQQSCDAADAVLIPMLWANTVFNQAHSNTTTTGTLYFNEAHGFIAGQTINITGNGSHHNGNKTITSVTDFTITYNITGTPAAANKHYVNPYGMVTGETYQDWTLDSAIQEAALMIAVDIWQARQTTSSGGISPDFQPSPYKMGNSLLSRVRGLIAHALDPRSMVG